MKSETLADLKGAFDGWRDKKRHVREAVPEELMKRARRAIGVYGVLRVARTTKIDRRRLEMRGAAAGKRDVPAGAVPSFSRVELAAVPGVVRPLAEVETPAGLKLRIFTQTDEMLGLVSSLWSTGGAR